MLPLAKSMRKKWANLVASPIRTEKKGQNRSSAGRRRQVGAGFSDRFGPSIVALSWHAHFGELRVVAALGVHMDGSHEEGSGSAPNAGIPAVRLLHYIHRGESHRSTGCHPDLYAGAQGDPRGGYCRGIRD